MKLSIAVTNYNRTEMLFHAIEQVLDDPRVDEIVISDDHSRTEVQLAVKEHYKNVEKVKIYGHTSNSGMHINKKNAVNYCRNEWVILLDSDNIISPSYIDAIPEYLDPAVIYMPDFAAPNFDYTKFAGRWTVKKLQRELDYKSNGMIECLMNTCNYLINRSEYLKTWKHNPDVLGADTIWFLYRWLLRGNEFHVVPKMQYYHRVHDGSGFMEDAAKNMKDAGIFKGLIRTIAAI